jgi:hypothetical protein
MKFLLARGQRGERLTRARGKNAAGLGQAAPPPVPLEEPLSGGRFEKTQVLARAGLSDAHRFRGSRDASATLDLDQQAQAR